MSLRRLFKREGPSDAVRRVYDAIVAQARRPVFYAELGVPDTVSGRFDMIVLHAFLVLDRLRDGGEEARAFAQSLTDELFRDMDRSLREMGVGDLSVGKKVRRMAEVFHGRLAAYAAARSAGAGALTEALARNVYAGAEPQGAANRLAGYVLSTAAALAAAERAAIIAGRVTFPDADRLIAEERP
jgi:cytochrome b pre-mRNA-processing protein 3